MGPLGAVHGTPQFSGMKEHSMRHKLIGLILVLAVPVLLAPSLGCGALPQLNLDDLFGNLFNQGSTDTDNGNGDTDNGNGDTDNGNGDTDNGNGDTDNGNGDTDNGNDDGSGTGGLTIVKTGISVRHDADLECGDDLIAYGTGPVTGVSYIFPSQNPTAGTAVTNGELYDSSAFAVGGRNIFLAGSNTGSLAFQVSVFNVDSATITKTFTAEEIRLNGIPVAAYDPGNIQANGNYCVVICDQNEVTDGKIIKVIDASGATPTLVAFAQNPIDYANGVDQVAVDGTTKKVIVAADGTFFIYDITNPNNPPAEIVSPNGIGAVQMKTYGNYVVALDDQGYPQAILVDLVNLAIITPTDGLATFDVAIGGGKYAFFADFDSDDSSGGHQRAAVGTVPQTSFAKAALGDYIDGSTTNNGLVGFASTMTIPPSGQYVFMAGWYFQYSTGGASFIVPADPKGEDPYACPAWDIDSSASVVGFKTSANRSDNTATTVGYVVLP
jgi:hypothetical protein